MSKFEYIPVDTLPESVTERLESKGVQGIEVNGVRYTVLWEERVKVIDGVLQLHQARTGKLLEFPEPE